MAFLAGGLGVGFRALLESLVYLVANQAELNEWMLNWQLLTYIVKQNLANKWEILGTFFIYRATEWLIMAAAEMVPDLILAPYYIGPQ